MATKNAGKAQKQETPEITVRIDRMIDYEGSKVKAIASANIGGSFAIHGIRVVDSQKGPFVAMPQSSYEKDGQKRYSDLFHPITAEAREELNGAVLDAYEQKLAETEDMGENEELPFGPSM